MIIGVTGHRGRLGKYLVNHLGYVPLECDVTDPDEVKREVDAIQPDTIIHCAAVTDVDGCENTLYDLATKVNVQGTNNIRQSFEGQVIYLSTDYVFDGIDGPYSEESYPSPICHYGYTKKRGEDVINEWDYPTDIIIRTTILYGGHKPDFATSILDRLEKNEQFPVTGIIVGNPTYIPHLAKGIEKLVSLKRPPRIVNIAGSNRISRWTFASLLAREFDYSKYNILMTMRVNGMADRPKSAGLKLDLAKALNIPVFSVHDGLEELRDVRQREIERN